MLTDRRRRFAAVAVAGIAAVLAACGNAAPPAAASSSAALTPSTLTGPLTVFAAASLTEAFGDAQTQLRSTAPGLSLTFNFAGSQTLVAQLSSGASADVIATADSKTMDMLVQAGLVTTPRTFAHNHLAIVVAAGNPRGIRALADLAAPGLTVVLADPSVPVGGLAQKALAAAGVTVSPKSLELDVKSVLSKVSLGEADAGIVYATDVIAAGSRASGVAIPAGQDQVATYLIAVLNASAHRAAAEGFVESAAGGAVQKALRGRGFAGP